MNVDDSTRLRFELMTEKDADLLFQLDQDPEVMRYITGGTMTTREEIRDTYVPRMQSYTQLENGWGLWKITVIESDEFIGWILVRPMNFFTDSPEDNNLEVGWRLIRSARGKGYATDAAKAVMQAIELSGNCDRFSALAMEDHQASINVMKKLGMRYLKSALNVDPLGDTYCVYYQRDVRQS
ncbi:MAG: GNAT family N-acetyltransferase [Fuerstiella sp.]